MNTYFNKLIIITITFLSLSSVSSALSLEENTMLGRGAQGEAVSTLQTCLITMGYELPKHGADGRFGSETRAQVILLQQEKDIKADGIVGPKTLLALECEKKEALAVKEVKLSETEEKIDLVAELKEKGCSESASIKAVAKENKLDVTVETKVTEEECSKGDEVKELDYSLEKKGIAPGEYTLYINGKEEKKTIEIKAPIIAEVAKAKEEVKVSNNTMISIVPKDGEKEAYVKARFNMNLTPIDTPLYVPVVAKAAGKIVVANAKTKEPVEVTQTITLESEAPKVTGKDGNEYFEVAEQETFTFTSSFLPAKGSYYATLMHVSFTSDDINSRNFKTFSGISLPLEKGQWSTDVVVIK